MGDNSSILIIGGIVAAALYFLNNTNQANVPQLPNIGGVVTTPAAKTARQQAPTPGADKARSDRIAQYVPLGKIEQAYWDEKKGVSYANQWTDNYNTLNETIETKRLKLGI
jgi:hypothetical protein